ncbi:MAG: heparinase II/III family protein [Alphaproteobacteria bacterium]|jgi:hypothetical protein|nr:heparinase II/III family protein [Alphaproteobacteria bacterium]
MLSRRTLLGAMPLLWAGRVLAAGAAPADPTLPPLALDEATIAGLRRSEDKDVRATIERLRRRAQETLTKKPIVREFEPGRNVLLPSSRLMLERALVLGLIARLDNDEAVAARLAVDLETVAGWEDWGPVQFLDIAEMATAVALAIGWLGPMLRPGLRDTLVAALVAKALEPGLAAHRAGVYWTKATHNWNLVCNSGLTVASLVVRASHQALADQVLEAAIASSRSGFSAYAPDGGYPEGAGYWAYGTRYSTLMVWALESVGMGQGLADSPGFGLTGDYILHMRGPTGLAFNYGDGPEDVGYGGMGWLGRRFNRPVDTSLALATRLRAFQALELVAGAHGHFDPAKFDLPLSRHFRAIDVACFRSSWTDPGAWFVGAKGGDNRVNHADLDLGSFVLDALGQRWAVELGPDDYALPGYFGSDKRWSYYRKATRGQNTLAFGTGNQRPDAHAPLTIADDGRARIDLSAAWDRPAGSIVRDIVLLPDHAVLVDDRIGPAEGRPVVWTIHSRAAITVEGNKALLVQEGRRLRAEILTPGGSFAVEPVPANPPEEANTGVVRLTIALPAADRARRIAVLFHADGAAPAIDRGSYLQG